MRTQGVNGTQKGFAGEALRFPRCVPREEIGAVGPYRYITECRIVQNRFTRGVKSDESLGSTANQNQPRLN